MPERYYRVVDNYSGWVVGQIAIRQVGEHRYIKITDAEGRVTYIPIDQMMALERV